MASKVERIWNEKIWYPTSSKLPASIHIASFSLSGASGWWQHHFWIGHQGLVDWSANAVRKPELLGPFADAMTSPIEKRAKTDVSEPNPNNPNDLSSTEKIHQQAILCMAAKHIRFAVTRSAVTKHGHCELRVECNYVLYMYVWLSDHINSPRPYHVYIHLFTQISYFLIFLYTYTYVTPCFETHNHILCWLG